MMLRIIRIAILLTVAPAAFAQAPPTSSAQFNVYVKDYIQGFYDQPPPTGVRWIFYKGEVITGSAGLLNIALGIPMEIELPAGIPIAANWIRVPDGASVSDLPSPRIGGRVSVTAPGLSRLIQSGERAIVPGRGVFAIDFDVDTRTLSPGIHQLALDPVGWKANVPIRSDQNVMTFEIREITDTARSLDFLARSARHGLSTNDLQAATIAVEDMLRVYADCALAFSLRGQIADRYGRSDEAAQAYATAATIIRENRDIWYVQRPRSDAIQ